MYNICVNYNELCRLAARRTYTYTYPALDTPLSLC